MSYTDTDCCDVCDTLLEIMCFKCPHYPDTCMPYEDEANHTQMVNCLGEIKDRLKGIYPEEDEIEV